MGVPVSLVNSKKFQCHICLCHLSIVCPWHLSDLRDIPVTYPFIKKKAQGQGPCISITFQLTSYYPTSDSLTIPRLPLTTGYSLTNPLTQWLFLPGTTSAVPAMEWPLGPGIRLLTILTTMPTFTATCAPLYLIGVPTIGEHNWAVQPSAWAWRVFTLLGRWTQVVYSAKG